MLLCIKLMGAFDFSAPKKKLEEIIIIEHIRKIKNKKGFTLVDLIVVLVILAILAALLIPALTGYIDKANKQKIIAETRQAVMSDQTIDSEQYAKGVKDMTATTAIGSSTLAAEVQKLCETKNAPTDITVTDGKVVLLTYTNGKTCTYQPANSSTNSDGDYNIAS